MVISASDLTLNPIDLFDTLKITPESGIKSLRKVQREVLEKYYATCRDSARVGIRLPTGTGKTLIALLILEAWRRADRNVAILAASQALAQDIQAKASQLDIPAVTIFGKEGDPSYKQVRAQNLTYYKQKWAIGVFNYHSYLYSTQYKQEIVPPHVLVIDDANEFETVRSDYFTLRVERDDSRDVYETILESLRPYFQLYPNLQSFLDGKGRPDAVEVIHFTHTREVLEAIRRHLSTLIRDDEFRFSYERNTKFLDSCILFVTADQIEFRPIIIPEEVLKLSAVPQIIFMGATLYSSDLLHKSFGIRESSISLLTENELSAEANLEAESFGRRLILPVDVSAFGGEPFENLVRAVVSICKLHGKVLVLANSKATSRVIQTALTNEQIPHLFYRTFQDGERFKTMTSGVLVCANRYVGLDFPGGTCKVAIIVTLPMFLEPFDMFQYSVLNNYPYIEQKVANRLTQAFGRCNRLENDEAIYYVLDPRFLSRFTGEEQYFRYLPRRIYAETYTGYFLSELGSFDPATVYAKNRFFGVRDANFQKFYGDARKNWKLQVPPDEGSNFAQEIEAWEKSLVGSYETSGQLFDLLSEQTKPRNALGAAWQYYLAAMNYRKAAEQYHNKRARNDCLESLQGAIDSGVQSSWFNHIRAVFNEIEQDKEKQLSVDIESIELRRIKELVASDYDNFIDSNSFGKKNWRSEFDNLRTDLKSGTHGEMLLTLMSVLTLLGYKTRKGDNSKGEPDIMSVSPLTTEKYQLSVEAKTKEEGEEELKKNVAQTLADARTWANHSPEYRTFPLLITQKETFSADAIRVGSKEVGLFRAGEFDYLLDKLFSKLDDWARVRRNSHQRYVFLDSIISPHELFRLFSPKEEPEIRRADIDTMIP